MDKVLLRMGICEIYFLDDIPPKVSISEMVEISKVYSTDESPVFINGILDTVYKDFQKKEKYKKMIFYKKLFGTKSDRD